MIASFRVSGNTEPQKTDVTVLFEYIFCLFSVNLSIFVILDLFALMLHSVTQFMLWE